MTRLRPQAGIYYFFKHEQGKHTLVLADSANAHHTSPGYEHVPYYPPSEREMRQQEHVDTWILSDLVGCFELQSPVEAGRLLAFLSKLGLKFNGALL